MTKSPSARSLLRTATASAHARVDHAFGAFDLGDQDGYRAFLLAQAGPLVTTEAAVDAFDPAALVPDWPERRRTTLIRSDLADLGLAQPQPQPDALTLATDAAALGAIYVLEGARLGGALLARNVPMDLPGRFIRSAPAPMRWRSLIEVLDKTLKTEAQRDAAIGAARAVFDLFWRGARQHGRMPVVE
ncbi:biliverdin-producing heme oxygenase [Sphingomonas sp.]|uniref:biliverdin-producing heme oxygenase n=1 Tax=Sphingomonas sp. TaxID=28214 RepID=UPI00183E9D8B|nr:biliverdin-producing heme oxygenase [Sphingomonas sp.]MBA4763021.1 biliverdin-producing heme oxygenase [Sphingomonas sp.]